LISFAPHKLAVQASASRCLRQAPIIRPSVSNPCFLLNMDTINIKIHFFRIFTTFPGRKNASSQYFYQSMKITFLNQRRSASAPAHSHSSASRFAMSIPSAIPACSSSHSCTLTEEIIWIQSRSLCLSLCSSTLSERIS
jgi:hypothetical protein